MLTAKQRKWLDLIRMATDGSGMYAGERYDVIPEKMRRLFERERYVEWSIPHNPAHKDRLAITQAGRDALAATAT